MTRPKRAPKKKPELTGPDATILEYLEKQYRPYSNNDIVQNLHGEVTKTAAAKAIEALSEDGRIVAKLFGKVMVSAANKVELSKEDANTDYDMALKDITESLARAEEELRELQSELKDIKQYPDDNTLNKNIADLQSEITSLEKKIKTASTKPSLSPASVQEVARISGEVKKESMKRVKMYKNFLKYLSEYIDPKTLINELGLEEPNTK